MGTELFCRASNLLYRRNIFTGIQETGQSFKNWDSCMANRACKIIAIVGICLAGVFVLWLVGAILSCLREGVTNIATFFCWCFGCRGSSSSRTGAPQVIVTPAPNQAGYVGTAAPNYHGMLHQPPQPVAAAQYTRGTFNSRSNRDPYYSEIQNRDMSTDEMSSDVYELEQDFDLEKQRRRSQRGSRMPNRGVVYDDDDDNNDNEVRNAYNNSNKDTDRINTTESELPSYTRFADYPSNSYTRSTGTSDYHRSGVHIPTQGYNPPQTGDANLSNSHVHTPTGHRSFDRHDERLASYRPQSAQVPYPDEDVFYTEPTRNH